MELGAFIVLAIVVVEVTDVFMEVDKTVKIKY